MLDSAIGLLPKQKLVNRAGTLAAPMRGHKAGTREPTALLRGSGRTLRSAVCAALGPLERREHGARTRRRGRRLRIRGWRLSLLLVLDRTQAGDIFHVLLVAFGKGVPAGSVGDEVKLLRASRTGGSLDGGTARIRDRPGRQTVDDVGVVGRRLGYLAFGQRMPERALAEDEAVNDRRIRLQLHLLLQPVGEHRRDARALLGFAGLFLDDGCEDDELLGALERQIRIASLPYVAHEPLLRLAHALDHLLAREAAMEMVAVGQKAAFPRDVLDIAGEDVVVEKARDDLLGSQAFGNGELMLHRLAFDDGFHHVLHAGAFG